MQESEALSQPCEDRDFAEWHQGCPWCAVWVVMLEGRDLERWVWQARSMLGDALLPRHARQPHITLAYRGLCGGGDEHAAREYDRLALRADVAMLQSLRLRTFTVQITGAGSFTTVPYLGVGQGQECLQQLHAALVPAEPASGWRYVPHVTLGHYARRLSLRETVDKLLALTRDLPVLEVKQLALARYAAADIAGPLTLEGVFELDTGRYVAAPGALWPEPL
jgi:2'-5' RNA ligase